MHTNRERLFTEKWLELTRCFNKYNQAIWGQSNKQIKQAAFDAMLNEIKPAHLIHFECLHQQSFKIWLVDTFQHDPAELHRYLFFLYAIHPDFHALQPSELGLLCHICRKDNALIILKTLFSNPKRSIAFAESIPPYALTGISEDVFRFLLDNHIHYAGHFSPIFWAIQSHQQDLLERILSYKPEWIHLVNSNGMTPLQAAIKAKNPEILSSLLKYKPNIHVINAKKQTIAHILCQTENPHWLLKLLHDPNYASLELISMFCNPDLKDVSGYNPLCYALQYTWYDIAKSVLKARPDLKGTILPFILDLSHANRFTHLKEICHELDFCPTDYPDYLPRLLLGCLEHQDIFNWYTELPSMTADIKAAAEILKHIQKQEWRSLQKFLRSTPILWSAVPNMLCFKITCLLLQYHQNQIIIEFDLFSQNDAFHRYFCPIEKITLETVVDYLLDPIDVNKKPHHAHKKLIQYFLNFLEKNPDKYPNWAMDYHGQFPQILTRLIYNKNISVRKEPLWHLLTSYFIHTYNLDDYIRLLTEFVDDQLDINAFDDQGQHLCYKLFKNHPQGLRYIQALKQHAPNLSLNKLDNQCTNFLHLAVEAHDTEAIDWCLKQNIDVCQERLTDHKSPLDLAWDYQQITQFHQIKKSVKKGQFMSLLEKLIREHQDSYLIHLLDSQHAFDWKFSEHHLTLLKTLAHPHIEALFFKKKPSPDVQVKKTAIQAPIQSFCISKSYILKLIHSKNTKKFDGLLDAVHQDELEHMFKNELFSIMREVFQSNCKSLNKTFIRIPAALKQIEAQNGWNHLFEEALLEANTTIIDNMLSRESIKTQLQDHLIRYSQIALKHSTGLWFESILPKLNFSNDLLQELLPNVLQRQHSDYLLDFFKSQTHQELLSVTEPENIARIFELDITLIQELLLYETLHTSVHTHIEACFKQALMTDQKELIHSMLKFPSLRLKLIDKMDRFVKADLLTQLIPLWQEHPEFHFLLQAHQPAISLSIPKLLQDAFALLYSSEHVIYLVGSYIHHLLGAVPFEQVNDLDFISPSIPDSRSHLKQSYIQPRLYFHNLFYCPNRSLKLEYFVSSQTEKNFIANDFPSRDFTVNSLYCDHNGHIFDPSGTGLKDLESKLIRSIQDPFKSLAQDPIRILRAFRLMVKGFKLHPDLHKALSEWQQTQALNLGHIYAMANTMFQSKDAIQIYYLFLEYHMLSKLLHIDEHMDFYSIQDLIQYEASRYKYQFMSMQNN